MYRVVEIDGRQVPLKACASLLLTYRAQFGRDFLADLRSIAANVEAGTVDGEAVETIARITWVMAKKAEPAVPDFETWLDGFDAFDVESLSEPVIELAVSSIKGTREAPKN